MKPIHPSGWAIAGAGFMILLSGCATQKTEQTQVTAVGREAKPARPTVAPAAAMTATRAWQRLQAGNTRFVNNRLEHPDCSSIRRAEVARGQHPFAVVLACSDSRVPPEIVFDVGLGDIFVVRVAGNTADAAAIGSIEYAVEHLHVPLVVVLGHERCGAVQAAVEVVDRHEAAPGHLGAIIDPIVPAVNAARGQAGDEVENTVRENVTRVVSQLRSSRPVLAEAVHGHHLAVLGARYDLDTGEVTLVRQPQAQAVPAGHTD